MGNFNWLHLSDIHFKQFENNDVSVIRNSFLKKISELKNIKYIFISGDIGFQGEYESSKELIDEIKKQTGVKSENVFWSVGNDDISRENESRNRIVRKIRNKKNAENKFQEEIKKRESKHLLYDYEFEDYYKKHKEILGYEVIDRPHASYEREDLWVINLNTCITSIDEKDPHELNIIEPEFIKLFEEKKQKPIFALGHYTIDFFCDEEKEKIQELFDGNIDLYLCGHAHRLGYRKIPDTELEVHEFICGGRGHDYAFMYGKYDTKQKKIRVYPYSYKENEKKEGKWEVDYNLHSKLTRSAEFYFNRLLPIKNREKKRIENKNIINEIETEDYKNLKDIIEQKHLDRRVKKVVNEWGLEKVCLAYTEFLKEVCYIPESIKYIEGTCIFKELVDVILETDSKFPLYISGKIGTGKSSFLTLLYYAMEKWGNDILVLYFDLHSYEVGNHNDAIERFNREAELFERFIKEEDKSIILIVDGLDEHNRTMGNKGINWISNQINILGNTNNKKIISLGIWGENVDFNKLLKCEDMKPKYTIMLNRLNTITQNDWIESFVRTQTYDEGIIDINVKKIKGCISRWKLEKVDFRLLCMMYDSRNGLIENIDNYTDFLKNYCMRIKGFNYEELERVAREAFYYNLNDGKDRSVSPGNYFIFKHIEISSFLIAYHFYNILSGREMEEKRAMFRKNIVFSKESNGHIKNLIKQDQENQLYIFQSMKEVLLDKSISIDMRAQICYLLPRAFKNVDLNEITQVLNQEFRGISEEIKAIDSKSYKNYDNLDKDKELILLYRTISCSMAIVGIFNPLHIFIKKMLTDLRYRELNKKFYCEYYANASDEKCLNDIGLLEKRENIKTTLFQLRHQISRAIRTKSFTNYNLFILDVLTYFTIVQEGVNSQDKLVSNDYLQDAQKVLKVILEEDEADKRIKQVPELYNYLYLMKINMENISSIGVLEKLYSLKSIKRSGWLKRGIKNGESVAEHIYAAYLLGLFYLPKDTPKFTDVDYSEYDKSKIIDMILLHDIGESYTGDIVSTEKTMQQEVQEQQFVRAIFMSDTYEEVSNLTYYQKVWEEYAGSSSINAKLAQEIDKIENLFQLLVYQKAGNRVEDFQEWKKYLRDTISTVLGKSIYEFVEKSMLIEEN